MVHRLHTCWSDRPRVPLRLPCLLGSPPFLHLVHDVKMSAQRQRGRETQAAVKALGSVFVGFVLRYVLLELYPVARDKAAFRTAELSFEAFC